MEAFINSIPVCLLFIHIYFIARYCLGNIYIGSSPGQSRNYLKWLLLVVLLPVVGYILYLRNRFKEENGILIEE